MLACDREVVERFNARAREGRREHVLLRLQHLPEPFLGRPDAPVVLLNLNPGFSDTDDEWHGNPTFAANLRANLAHEMRPWPFYLLNPEFPSPGHGWWRTRMRELIEATSAEAVAQHVLCVELHAYHSVSFGLHGLAIPSQDYGIHLVREAMARGALIVRMRSEGPWFERVPELATYTRLVRTRSWRAPYLSKNNLREGFAAIVDAIRRSSLAAPGT